MADTSDTKEGHIDGTRYVPMKEYVLLLKSYHKLDLDLQRELRHKKWFGLGAIILASWGSAALFLSECNCRGNSGYVSIDAGNADAGSDYSEEHGCYGPKTIGEFKQKIGDLEKKVEDLVDCQRRNKELSGQLNQNPNPAVAKPTWCPPVKECPYIKQY